MKLKESLVTRRQFLGGWLAGTGSLLAAYVFYPLLRFVLPQELEAAVTEVQLPLADYSLTPNSGKLFRFGRKPGLLVRTEQDEWLAFNAVCTHFECTVHYNPETRQIACPCHQGYYDVYGRNLKGPPPRPLERYDLQVAGAALIVTRPGAVTADKGKKV